jgi:outer membrane receptor protein involved in Fe transport
MGMKARAAICATPVKPPKHMALRMAIASVLSGAAAVSSMPARAADTDVLAEITVTARKQTENLQDVPQSIDVFTAKDIQNLNISQFEDYATRSPSVSFISIGPGYQQFFMRGVSDGSSPNVANTSTTGMFIDEVSMSWYGGIPDLHLYDIERIEVLNGPQGTLYGASSMSGAIRIVTNKPDAKAFAAGIDVDAGQIDGGEQNKIFEGYVNVPLIDDVLALRVSGFYDYQGGFIDNLLTTRDWLNGTVSNNSQWAGNNYNHETMYGGRAAVDYKINDSWSALVSGDFQTQSTHGAWDQDPTRYGERNVSRFGPESGERINRLMSVTVKGDVGIGDLIYAGGYWNRYNHTINEYSEYVQYANIQPNTTGYQTYAGYVQSFACQTSAPSGVPGVPDSFGGCNVPTMFTNYHDTTEQWSHELRLSSKPGGSTHWTVGFYFQQTKDVYSDFYDYPGINFQGQAAQLAYSYYTGAAALPGEWYSYSNQRTDNHQVAGFGEITQDITSRWSVIFGFREFKSRDSSSDQWSGYFYQPKVPTPTESVSFTKQSYKAGINFKYSDNTLFYASFAQGFRDGGFNTSAAANPGVPATYQPDTLNSYELGWKTVAWEGRLLWNSAVYYMPWKDYQTAVFDLAISPVTFNANIGDARIYGMESNIEVKPVHGLTLSLSVSYNDSELTSTSFTNPNYITSTGQRLPFVPYYKGSATGRYEWNVGPNYNAYTQFDVSRTGDMWSDLNTSPLSTTTRSLQPAYDISNVRLGFTNARDNWGAELYVTNLDNTRAVIYTNKYNYDGRETTNQPRVLGLRFKYRFGGKDGKG